MMATARAAIDSFVQGKTLALVGVSASGRGFGNAAFKELKARGYRVFPVHPTAATIQGEPCWKRLSQLPEPIDRLLVVTAPSSVEEVAKEAAAAGIRQVWLQQGASTPATVKTCEDLGLQVVHDQCILMFAEPPTGFHKVHRWIWDLLGKIPKRMDLGAAG
jgi:predicted CoA-binding protein